MVERGLADADAGRVISDDEMKRTRPHLPLALPDIGHLCEPEKHPGVRILLYGRYRIVYQRRSDENVHVLGVFHGALDLKRHLRLTGHEGA